MNRLNIMREHIIRLRGGWIWGPTSEPEAGGSAGRATLPLTWPAGVARRVWLVRLFQAPPIDLRHESLGLRLDEVAGLVAVVLNGAELARPPSGTATLWLPLPRAVPLPRRNRLVLEVEPPLSPVGPSPDRRPWGSIALVVSVGEPGEPGRR